MIRIEFQIGLSTQLVDLPLRAKGTCMSKRSDPGARSIERCIDQSGSKISLFIFSLSEENRRIIRRQSYSACGSRTQETSLKKNIHILLSHFRCFSVASLARY